MLTGASENERLIEMEFAEPPRLSAEETASHWWQWDEYSSAQLTCIASQQCRVWHELQSLPSWSHLPSGLVLGLTVRDPRLFLPKKKTLLLGDEEHIAEARTLNEMEGTALSIHGSIISSPV